MLSKISQTFPTDMIIFSPDWTLLQLTERSNERKNKLRSICLKNFQLLPSSHLKRSYNRPVGKVICSKLYFLISSFQIHTNNRIISSKFYPVSCSGLTYTYYIQSTKVITIWPLIIAFIIRNYYVSLPYYLGHL